MESNPFLSAAERQLEELLAEDFPIHRPKTTNNTPIKTQMTQPKKTTRSADKAKKPLKDTKPQRGSVIDPPNDFRDQRQFNDSFELLESIINENYDTLSGDVNDSDIINLFNSSRTGFYLHDNENSNGGLDKSFGTLNNGLGGLDNNLGGLDNKSYLANEDGSYSENKDGRKYSDDMSSIDPRLINENDNLSIPENLNTDSSTPTEFDNSDVYASDYSTLRASDVDKKKQFEEKTQKTYFEEKKQQTYFEEKTTLCKGKVQQESKCNGRTTKQTNAKNSKSMPGNQTKDNSKRNDDVDHYSLQYDKKISQFEKSLTGKNKSKVLEHSVSLTDEVDDILSSLDDLARDVTANLQAKKKNETRLPRKSSMRQNSTTSLNSSFGSGERVKNLSSLKRSMSLLDSVPNPRSLRSKEDVDSYFEEQKSPGKEKFVKEV